MKFTMTVDMEKAAFEDEPATELGRIVGTVRTKVLDGVTSGACRDVNGNRCGHWEVKGR